MAEDDDKVRAIPDVPLGQSWLEVARDGYRTPTWDEEDEEVTPSKIEELRRRLGL
jgi:hypothetical protein